MSARQPAVDRGQIVRPRSMTEIRRAVQSDWKMLWTMFRQVLDRGDAFMHETMEPEDAFGVWFGGNVRSFVAVGESGDLEGAYFLQPNFPGRGSHVANGTYLVNERCRGAGVGRRLGEHSIEIARDAGFRAIQFNGVVSTNTPAVSLWKSLGFEILGAVPDGFRHEQKGFVDLLIMYRTVALT